MEMITSNTTRTKGTTKVDMEKEAKRIEVDILHPRGSVSW